jgi:hypothetical protein
MNRALAILDREPPSPIACYLQTAIDLLIEDAVRVDFARAADMNSASRH